MKRCRIVAAVAAADVPAVADALRAFSHFTPERPETGAGKQWRDRVERLEAMQSRLKRICRSLFPEGETGAEGRDGEKIDLDPWDERLEELDSRLAHWQEEFEEIEETTERLRGLDRRLRRLADAGVDLERIEQAGFLDIRLGWVDRRQIRRITFPAFRTPLLFVPVAEEGGAALVAAAAPKKCGFVLSRVLGSFFFDPLFPETGGRAPEAPERKPADRLDEMERRQKQIQKQREKTAAELEGKLSKVEAQIEDSLAAARFVRRYAAAGTRRYYFRGTVPEERLERLVEAIDESADAQSAVAVVRPKRSSRRLQPDPKRRNVKTHHRIR